MESSLRSVPVALADHGPGDPPPTGETPRVERSRPHPRAQRALPTDRMRFDVQVQALKAFAVTSKYGQFAVTSEEIASILPVSATTAGLNNNFCYEAGLLVRESKGRYKPTEAVNQFARDHSWAPDRAGRALAPILAKTWFYEAVENQLAMGPATRQQLVSALGQVAGATTDHTGHLDTIVQWLDYAQLIRFDDAGLAHPVALEDTPAEAAPVAATEPEANEEPDGSRGGGHDDGGTPPRMVNPAGVLGLTFDFQLTAEDLAKLSTEQIEALFAAVGKVMAIKAAVGSTGG